MNRPMLRWRVKSNGMCAKKLTVDFAASLRLRSRMDDDTLELIVQLCTRAGMAMEDASVIALSVAGPRDDANLERALEELRLAAEVIRTCIDTASTLAR